MKRGLKKAIYIASKIGRNLPVSIRRDVSFQADRKPLNKIPAYMRTIARKGAAVTNAKRPIKVAA